MSLYLADERGHVGDLGSATGYCSFLDWGLTLRKPVLTKFLRRGETKDLGGLIEVLASVKAPNEEDAEVRRAVLAAAKKARRRHGGCLICAQ